MRRPKVQAVPPSPPAPPRPPTIIEALDDADLLGGMMDGPSWRPWRSAMRAIFALDMDADDLATYRQHTGRQAPPTEPFRSASLIVGRRGGKSRLLGVTAAFLATCYDHSPYIVAGETPIVAVIAKDRDQARVCLNYILGTLRASPALSGMIGTVLNESVTLTNGVVIEVHTASIAAPRGRTFVAVLCDEIAFWPATGDSANPDVEVINAIRPGLTTIPYSLLLIASSPYARRGVLYSNFARFYAKDDARTLVWKASTVEMNSTLEGDPLIEEAYSEDSERAEAEYGGNFRSDIVSFVTREGVEAVLANGLLELPPGGLQYAAFVDPSGGSADSFTLAIGHVESDGTAVLDALRERRPPFSPDAVVEEFAALLKTYGITRITGDNYAGLWPKERFANHGITYETSSRNKNQIYTEFLPALNGRRIRLLDLPRLTAQLIGLERRTARGGRDSIDHAPGGHDDAANAAAGVLVQLLDDRRPTLIRAADMRVENQPVSAPPIADVLLSVMIVAPDGMVAVTHLAYTRAREGAACPGLVLLDFDLAPYGRETITAAVAAQAELAKATRPLRGRTILVPEPLAQHFHSLGFQPQIIDPLLLQDPDSLALSCAGPIAEGRVKIATKAAERAASSPLGGELSFRAGDDIAASSLRLAFLVGVSSCFVQEAARSGPVQRAA